VRNVYNKITEALDKNEAVALCTIVTTRGSTPRKTGAKMLVYASGSIYGTIGGGELERNVIRNALEVIKSGGPKLFRHDLLHQHQMCCGGTVEIYIEPIMKKSKLYIFGGGHTGQALANFACHLEFEVVLIDDRRDYLDKCTTKEVNKMNLDFNKALQVLPFDENTYVTIMTYDHPLDRDILLYCIKRPHAYVGMIGSRRKVELTKKMFAELGKCQKTELDAIDMPMGIDIAAEGPQEIAISILAGLIKTKNKLHHA